MSKTPTAIIPSIRRPCQLIHLIYGCYYPVLRDWNYSAVSSECWKLYWNPRPGAELRFHDEFLALTSDQVILIPPFTVHSSRSHQDFTHFCLHFHAMAPYDHVRKQLYVLPAEELKTELECVLQPRKHPQQTWFYWLRLATAALLNLPDCAFLPETAPGHDPLIQRALELLDNTPYSLGNEELCRRLGISTTNFYLRFKEETGLSPARYQLNRRLEKASQMLLNDDLPVTVIAEQTGFADRFHFSKAFKALFHLTPIQFREKNLPLPGPH